MKIIAYLKEWIKTLALVCVIIVVLKFTGLLSSVSYVAQSAVLKTGLMDASDKEEVTDEAFDYAFTIKDLAGNKFTADQYKGKVLFINIWATWCGPCRAEMKGIQKLYDKMDHNQVQFIMLSVDKDGSKDKVVSYLKDKGFTFPAFMPSGYLTSQLNVPGIPTTFVISKDGKIVAKEVGMKDYDTSKFKKFLDKLIAE